MTTDDLPTGDYFMQRIDAYIGRLEADLAALRQRHAELEKQLAQLREWKREATAKARLT